MSPLQLAATKVPPTIAEADFDIFWQDFDRFYIQISTDFDTFWTDFELTNLDAFRQIFINFDRFPIHFDRFRQISTHFDRFRQYSDRFWYPYTFRQISTDFDSFRQISTHFDIFRQISTHFDRFRYFDISIFLATSVMPLQCHRYNVWYYNVYAATMCSRYYIAQTDFDIFWRIWTDFYTHFDRFSTIFGLILTNFDTTFRADFDRFRHISTEFRQISTDFDTFLDRFRQILKDFDKISTHFDRFWQISTHFHMIFEGFRFFDIVIFPATMSPPQCR